MVYVYAVVLTLVNLLCWVGILFGLPGTWLMVLFPVLLKWWASVNPQHRHLWPGLNVGRHSAEEIPDDKIPVG